MVDYSALEHVLTMRLGLTRRPVAIAFRATAPAGVPQAEGAQPSGCSFWRLAAQGQTFYTVPADHYNCPVGSYTHNIALPPDREPELMQTLSLMGDLGYIRLEEVPSLPRLPQTPGVVIYSPLATAPTDPDVIMIAGTPGRLMLLHEAASRASKNALSMLGRPTCMAIPASLGGGVVSSFGCVGNRVYTGITDDEFYTAISGTDIAAVADQLATIVSANAQLERYHRDRRSALGSS